MKIDHIRNGLLIFGAICCVSGMTLVFSGCGNGADMLETSSSATESESGSNDNENLASSDESSAYNTDQFKDNSNGTRHSTNMSAIHVDMQEVADILYVGSENVAARTKFFKLSLDESSTSEYKELNAAFDNYNKETENSFADALKECKADFDEISQFVDDESQHATGEEISGSIDELSGIVLRADSNVVSIYTERYQYVAGGAHGTSIYDGLAFDTETGYKLKLTDVLKDEAAFKELLITGFKEKYEVLLSDMDVDIDEYVNAMDFSSDDTSWSIDNLGVTVYFQQYELGAYAMGSQNVRVYFDEAPEVFAKKYSQIPKSFVIPLNYDESAETDVDGDGERETIICSFDSDDDGYYYHAGIAINDKKTTIEGIYSASFYLVCSNGKYYIYAFTTTDNDYNELCVVNSDGLYDSSNYNTYSLFVLDTTENIKLGDDGYRFINSKAVFTDPESFKLDEKLDMLGTHSAYRTYHVGEDGYPISDDKYYDIINLYALRNKQEINCTIVDETDNMLSDTVIREGTYLVPVRTDKDGYIDLQEVNENMLDIVDIDDWHIFTLKNAYDYDASAATYRISYTYEEYPAYVNGIEEHEIFEGINYAG